MRHTVRDELRELERKLKAAAAALAPPSFEMYLRGMAYESPGLRSHLQGGVLPEQAAAPASGVALAQNPVPVLEEALRRGQKFEDSIFSMQTPASRYVFVFHF